MECVTTQLSEDTFTYAREWLRDGTTSHHLAESDWSVTRCRQWRSLAHRFHHSSTVFSSLIFGFRHLFIRQSMEGERIKTWVVIWSTSSLGKSWSWFLILNGWVRFNIGTICFAIFPTHFCVVGWSHFQPGDLRWLVTTSACFLTVQPNWSSCIHG